jgi:hypothetical protein
MSGARAARESGCRCEQARLVRTGGAVYDPGVAESVAEPIGHSSLFRSPAVFSLLGVIGITLVLFLVVALTAGLVLGK